MSKYTKNCKGKNLCYQHVELGCFVSECTYIDDRRYNLVAAQSIGMDTILFNSRNVQYEGKTVMNFKELANMLLDS
jgi:putative hydrolase of the HAD superfamily